MKLVSVVAVIMFVMACGPMAGRKTAGEYINDATITSIAIVAIIDDPVLKKSQISLENVPNTV